VLIKAAVLRGPDAAYRIEDVTLAEPGPGEVLVRIKGVGLCHTDTLPRRTQSNPMHAIVPGHEGAGVVEIVGPYVDGLQPDDHVVLTYDSCRACGECMSGSPAYCETFTQRNLRGTGLDQRPIITDSHGAPVAGRWFGQSSFATHAVVAARNVIAVDKQLPIELLGPLGCGVQTGAGAVLVALDARAGSTIVVFGAGGVGLSAVMAAKLAGASTIIAVDLHENRLTLASELGATHTFVGSEQRLASRIRAITDGGAHFALDTTSLASVAVDALKSLRPSGVCGLLGLPHGDIVVDPALLLGRSITGIVEGNTVPQVFIPKLITLWRQGMFPFDKLIKTFRLDEINEAERASADGSVIKPVLLPHG
jgi:aryl-alcohol dehydrogenase